MNIYGQQDPGDDLPGLALAVAMAMGVMVSIFALAWAVISVAQVLVP